MKEKFDRDVTLYWMDDLERDKLINDLLSVKENKKSVTALSDKEYHALKLLDYCTDQNRGGPLIASELEFLQNFLIENMGNMTLNRKLRTISDTEIPGGDKTADYICSFTYATQNIEGFFHAADKLDCLIQNVDQAEKITIEEVGLISRAVSLSKRLEEIEMGKSLNLFTGDYLGAFADRVKNTSQTFRKVEEKIFTELKLESGDLMFEDGYKSTRLVSEKINLEQRLIKRFITKYHHVSKIIVQPNSSFKQAHLQGDRYRAEDKIQLKEYLYSSVLKIDVTKLISQANQEELNAKAPNWKEEIKKQYQVIQDKIYQAQNDKNIYEGMHAHINLFQRINIGLSKIFSVNQRKRERKDLNQIRDKMFGGQYSLSNRQKEGKDVKKMMCSAFIASEMVASLVDLNEWVENKYGLKKAIELPFDEDIKFSKILPERLYDILIEKGVCTEVERTPTEKKIFATEENTRKNNLNINCNEELIRITEDVIAEYRSTNDPINKIAIRDHFIEKISELLIQEKNPQAITIDEKDLKLIQMHVDTLVSNDNKQNSRSFVKRWVEQAMDDIGIKKSKYNKAIESEVLKIKAIVKKQPIKQTVDSVDSLSVAVRPKSSQNIF